jgi:demethylmenaquinone methyltransferase / 2-methoxy-6-polyprenyl-1,4-benzoquinol methylase
MTDKVNFGDETGHPAGKDAPGRQGLQLGRAALRPDERPDVGGLHRRWKDRFVARVKPRPGEHVLDMAGGTGDVAFRMARRGARVTIADINPDMLAVGMERAETQGLEGLSWKQENAEGVCFEDSSFDAYTIAFGIRNVADIPAALGKRIES